MPQVPYVSVGIPVYNGQEHLGDTVAALLSQTLADLELVICDNASTDETEALCRQLVSQDARIKYFRNARNMGAPTNYNLCVQRARGKYFKWNSANDLCRPELLERCIALLEADPDAALAYTETQLLHDNGRLENVTEDLELASEDAVERFIKLTSNIGLNHIMNGVMRRDQLLESMLHESFYSSDLCLMAELSLRGKFVKVPEYLFVRRHTLETASAMRTGTELQQYYDPQLKTKMPFQHLKLYRGYFRAVHRSHLPKSEKRILYRFLMQQLRWSRYNVFKDMLLTFKRFVGGA